MKLKSLLLFACCMGILFPAFAQEDKAITAKLEEKYFLAVYHDHDGGWYSIRANGKEGACDLKGNEVIPPIYDDVHFDGNYYKVKLNGKVAIRDLANRELLPFKYEDVLWYQIEDYGYCEVKLNGKKGVVDKQGNEIVAPKYDDIAVYDFKDKNYAGVTLNGKEGVVDKQGNEIIACEYTYIAMFGEDKAVVAKGGNIVKKYYSPTGAKWGMYDLAQKKRMVECKYDYLSRPSEGLAAFNIGGNLTDGNTDKISGGKWGYMDIATGKEIIPAQYETAEDFKDGAAMVSQNGQTALIENPLAKGKANIGNPFAGLQSDVDVNIPVTDAQNPEFFAFIFANENYPELTVPAALNDGKVVKDYCQKTLGIPEKNIRFYEDATINNITSAVNRIKEIADAFDGDARFLFYYSGQGITDENNKIRYLLPVDASLTGIAATGYSVDKLSRELSQVAAQSVLVVLDAGFNGYTREGKALAAARGVAVKPKAEAPAGSLILFSATSGDEVAGLYSEQNHGLFTYHFLKKLQETKGNVSCKELSDYVTSAVKRQTVSGSKVQSPAIIASDQLINWQTLKIK
ncbi:MAG: WG repeat-containing protein [Prevotellaceae bacterium]|jgi:hypothetical protein|nr:WG repeat-containing protein [Prevotellaceae bacterium]